MILCGSFTAKTSDTFIETMWLPGAVKKTPILADVPATLILLPDRMNQGKPEVRAAACGA
jgi:hypothetical protein